MTNSLIHTPEGVRDIYGEEFIKKEAIENTIKNELSMYGYMSIQTPSFEFFDVFSKQIGTTPSRELYKFFDKENNTLVLRSDFTPGIARASAKYFAEEKLPVRWIYSGNVFNNISDHQGKLKETTQIGAECIGEPSVAADAELIAMAVNALKETGLSDFILTVGHMDYFKGICMEAGISDELQMELREQISGKNYFGTEELLKELTLPEDIKNQLLAVSDLHGDVGCLDSAFDNVNNDVSRQAIERLKELYGLLKLYGVEKHVGFDLGMLSKYHYYTGIIFKGYTYGVGEPIVKGGRYDRLLSIFGKDAAAVGFVISVDLLLNALERQHAKLMVDRKISIVVYEEDCYRAAVEFAINERASGAHMSLVPRIQGKDVKDHVIFGCDKLTGKIYYVDSEGVTLV